MKRFIFILGLLGQLPPLHADEHQAKPAPYNEWLMGYGSSQPGWGETTERVQTVDIVLRHCRPFFEKEQGLIKGKHEFWIEAPFSFIVADSGTENGNDLGIFGLNFLFAWIFPETDLGSPYFILGGGPVYVAADINGVGSNLCGNYQMGAGFRIPWREQTNINLEARFHHISNLNMASPNVPLNSFKIYLGATLPF